MSVESREQSGAVIESNVALLQQRAAEALYDDDSVPVVASKSGAKYHLLDCPGAKQMKPENKIEFSSIELAKAAGYTPAGNCPGLQ